MDVIKAMSHSIASFRAKKERREREKEAQGDDELEQVTGTAEDDVAEAIARIRERELLYGRNSLLTIFGPMAAYVCANNKTFNVSES
jgi:condensin complex subunit 1